MKISVETEWWASANLPREQKSSPRAHWVKLYPITSTARGLYPWPALPHQGNRSTRPRVPPKGGDPILTPSQAPPAPGLLPGLRGCTAPPELAPVWGRHCGPQAVGQPQLAGLKAQLTASPSHGGRSPGVMASAYLPQQCRACSLWLTTSDGLPEAEPRDPAATPSPFLSPSHNPAPSAGPDAVVQRAGLMLWATSLGK